VQPPRRGLATVCGNGGRAELRLASELSGSGVAGPAWRRSVCAGVKKAAAWDGHRWGGAFMPASRSSKHVSLLLGGIAFAAIGGQARAETQTDSAEPAAATLGEVIVTAQRRAERLSDVPITITAKSGEQLERAGVRNIADLSSVAPGVTVALSSQYLQPTVRGVSGQSTGSGSNAPVAIYVDGAYKANQLTTRFEFADLEQIQVLKGPQGTLYGRNATGGAIVIRTRSPAFTPAGDFAASYGNYDRVQLKAFVTGPIVPDRLAASLAAYYERRDSYNYNIATRDRPVGVDTKSVRAKLLFTPSEKTRFTLTLYYENRKTDNSQAALNGNSVAAQDTAETPIFATRPFQVANNWPERSFVDDRSILLNSEFDLGFGTLTSISQFERSRTRDRLDPDGAYNPRQFVPSGNAFDNIIRDTNYSEDLVLTSRKFGSFSFLLGASAFYQNNHYDPLRGYTGSATGQPVQTLFISEEQPNTAYAGFAEGTLDLTSRLTVTAGARYSWESVKNYGELLLSLAPAFNTPFPGNIKRTTFNKWTFRFSAKYRLMDDTNAYFTFSQGFKSGGFGATSFSNPVTPPFNPETIDAYEVGLKGVPNAWLSYNLSGFYYKYTNLQVLTLLGLANGVTLNAASSKIYGLDADVTARPAEPLTLTAGLELLSAEYKKYPQASAQAPMFLNGKPNGNANQIINANGNRMPLAPSVTFSLGVDYKKDLGPGVLDLNVNAYHSSKIYFDSIERISQGGWTTVNALASWRPTGSRLSFEVWGRNLTNRKYLGTVFEAALADFGSYAPPRTYGVTVRYMFGS
jgi:iron complex outermembrane receptor protein